VGNVCVDALSSSKYWHFVRLMGRAASNITLEVALQTAPTMALIGEEVAARHQNLASITDEIVHVVLDRAALGLNHGVVLVPGAYPSHAPRLALVMVCHCARSHTVHRLCHGHIPPPPPTPGTSTPRLLSPLPRVQPAHGATQHPASPLPPLPTALVACAQRG
jgi:6-phosphofructokinase